MSQTTYTLDERITALAQRNATVDKKLMNGLTVVNAKAEDAIALASSVSLRNVGEIVYSTIPLIDASVHLANGLEILHNGVYSAFVAYMKSLYEDENHTYDNLFTTQAQFDQAVAEKGSCGKYVYNTTTGDLRLPKLTGILTGTVDQSAIGSFLGSTTSADSGTNTTSIIKGYVYIVLANSVKTPVSVNDTTESSSSSSDSVPVGTIIMSATTTVPAGYLLCNGSAVSRTTYPDLFEAIGTIFGSGDGSTTFNLPNLIDKFIEGSTVAGVEHEAGLPNITGSFGITDLAGGNGTGAFIATKQNNLRSTNGSADGCYIVGFNAADSNDIYGNSDTVQPPAVTALPCIKAFSSVIGDATVVAGQLVNEIQSKVALDGSNTSSISSTLSTYMANAAMPNGQYINLTLPASDGTVTAPADGYITLRISGSGTVSGVFLRVQDTGLMHYQRGFVDGMALTVWLPVKKNDVVTVFYISTSFDSNSYFRFIYANGSAPTV